MINIFTRKVVLLIALLFSGAEIMAQGPGLVIQRFFTKPSSGNESPYEFVELVTTRAIDFSTDRYTIVFCDAKDASAVGWPQGGAYSYALEIPVTAGIVPAGSVIYAGGSSMMINGTSCYTLRQINTATTTGDGFGNASANGVLGNGGSHADGLAVFNSTAAAIISSSVPADAVFFGSAVGNAAGKFKVPASDMYTGGTFGTGTGNSTLAVDPSGGQYVYATGTFNTVTGIWDVPRSWAQNSLIPSCADIPSVTLVTPPQGPGLVIQRFFTKPSSGNESPYEFAELITTRNIDFSTDRYTIIFCDAKDASTAGWPQGGAYTYAFEIPATAGVVAAGSIIYVGGSSLDINGTSCSIPRQINTALTPGDGFGNASANGVLGNGGSHADGLAVFNNTAAAITSSTVPADVVFFGSAVGNAAGKFTVPVSDMYTGGTFGTGTGNSSLADDPSGGQYVYATGIFNTVTGTWDTPRTWAKNNIKPSCADIPTITFSTVPPVSNTLSIFPDTVSTTAYIKAPYISGVINDPTDPAAITGLVMQVKDNDTDIPATDYTLTASSNDTNVVHDMNIQIVKADGRATIKIIPTAVGYTTLIFTLTKNGTGATYSVNYAASAAAAFPAQAVFHTGYSDASTAVALDDNYMIVSDDEKNILNLYSRSHSGLPVKAFDYSTLMGLTDMDGGAPREIDLEASARSLGISNKIYWLGSHGNKSNPGFSLRPNRNRIFATDVTGTDTATAFTFAGYYDGLRVVLNDWGNTHSLGLAESMADGQDPKLINGFNMEGMAFAPDSTTMYIGFRAPLEPVTNRINALIAPITDFETWFGNGTTTEPTLGDPILLNLGGRGIREITRLYQNMYIILAGDYDDAAMLPSAVYRWNGNPSDAPVELTGFDVSGLNPEGTLPVYNAGVLVTDKLELVSDNGTIDYYGDGIAAKDLSINNFKKFRSDLVVSPGQPLPVVFENFNARYMGKGIALLEWRCVTNAETAGFEIERSQDGTYFERVGRVAVKNAGGSYQYTDKVCCAESFFYRIKEVTKDGSVYYSAVKLVRLPSDTYPVLIAYDPNTDLVRITAQGFSGSSSVRIINTAGQVIFTTGFSGTSGVLSLSGLAHGVYIIDVNHSGVNTRKKLVK